MVGDLNGGEGALHQFGIGVQAVKCEAEKVAYTDDGGPAPLGKEFTEV